MQPTWDAQTPSVESLVGVERLSEHDAFGTDVELADFGVMGAGAVADQSQGGRGRPPLRKRSCYDSIFIWVGDEILQLRWIG